MDCSPDMLWLNIKVAIAEQHNQSKHLSGNGIFQRKKKRKRKRKEKEKEKKKKKKRKRKKEKEKKKKKEKKSTKGSMSHPSSH